jgi:predicted flap endonuclease-1-like 5' DNA nuclease
MNTINRRIARRLEEAADLLQSQAADRFRVNAYRRAAVAVRSWPESLDQTYRRSGLDGLERVPGVGPVIARAIRELITRGQLPMLDRLRGAADPEKVLGSVPGIGRTLAGRLHVELGIHTLEDLEAAAHDGRLDTIAGFGRKRLAGIRDSLAQRLGRVRPDARATPRPPISELLDVDREYRDKASRGQLPLIAPRRFNPEHTAWLPVLHTERNGRRYTALFSNTARAHRLRKTRDWVVIYADDSGGDHQHTVITARRGSHRGTRIVAGREGELDQSSQVDDEQPPESHAAAVSR